MSNFKWTSEQDGDLYRSLSSLVKHNGGFFKSLGQARYLSKAVDEEDFRSPKLLKDGFGLHDAHLRGYRTVIVKAHVIWASANGGYVGRRSYRTASWMFILDDAGVVAKYKLHRTHQEGSSQINPQRTELLWSRPEDQQTTADNLVKTWALEAAQKQREKVAAHDAADVVPTGRVTVTGMVLSVKEKPNYYGGYNSPQTVFKMLIQDDRGFKVWTSVPSQIVNDVARNVRVRFDAKLTPSTDDPKFGFGNRPTKAEILDGTAEA